MDNPFENDVMDEADGADALDAASADEGFDEGDAGDGFDSFDSFDDAQGDAADDLAVAGADFGDALGEGPADGGDDLALWDAFEDEVADGLDAADEDEFLGRLLGGLGRAAGAASRGFGAAGNVAGRLQGLAHGAGRIAGQVGRVAGRVSPAAQAAARLARMLGAPGLAGGLQQVGRGARTLQGLSRQSRGMAGHAGRAAGHAQGMFGQLGQAAGGAQGLLGQLSQLIGAGGDEFDDFDAVADLYAEDGVDEALPAAVALAARAAARGLGFANVAQLTQAGRRALVRGVASAARELVRSGEIGRAHV